MLADRLAEAFAEYMHDRVRHVNWGYNEGPAGAQKDIALLFPKFFEKVSQE